MNDALTIAKTYEANASELRKLADQRVKFQTKADEIQSQIAGIDSAIEALSGVSAVAVPAKTRKVVRKGKALGRPKGTMNPTSLKAVLLRIAPASSETPVDKETLLARVKKAKYTSAGKLDVMLGTALSRSDFFEHPERGLWRRNAAGDAQLAVLNAPKAE